MQYIVHDDETMDNPYCNHCGCGMPFSGRLVWSTLKFGGRSLFQHAIAMPFSAHNTASSLFLGLACPLLGNFTPSAQAICILVVAVCTVSIAHVDFFYWKLHFFCSLQKDVYEELCGLFSNINLSVYSPIFAFISDNATRKNGK